MRQSEISRLLVTEKKFKGMQSFSQILQEHVGYIKNSTKQPVFHKFLLQNKNQHTLMICMVLADIQKGLLERLKSKTLNLQDFLHFQDFLQGKPQSHDGLQLVKKFFIESNNKLKLFQLPESFADMAGVVEAEAIKDFFARPKQYYEYLIAESEKKDFLKEFQQNYQAIDEIMKDQGTLEEGEMSFREFKRQAEYMLAKDMVKKSKREILKEAMKKDSKQHLDSIFERLNEEHYSQGREINE